MFQLLNTGPSPTDRRPNVFLWNRPPCTTQQRTSEKRMTIVTFSPSVRPPSRSRVRRRDEEEEEDAVRTTQTENTNADVQNQYLWTMLPPQFKNIGNAIQNDHHGAGGGILVN